MVDWKWLHRRCLPNKWDQIIFLISMVVFWYIVTVGRWSFENQGEFYILKMALISKIGLVAAVYLAREILFREARIPGLCKFLLLFWVFIITGSQTGSLFDTANWFYRVFILLDAFIWSLFLAMISESMAAVFYLGRRWTLVGPGEIYKYRRQMRMELVKFGLILTVLSVFGYIFLVNFLVVNTILYSYLLLIPLLGGGGILFSVFRVNLANWFEAEQEKIDSEIGNYLAFRELKQELENESTLQKTVVWLEYLYGLREYLNRLRKPRMSWWLLVSYLGYSLLILSLPYLINVVIEV